MKLSHVTALFCWIEWDGKILFFFLWSFISFHNSSCVLKTKQNKTFKCPLLGSYYWLTSVWISGEKSCQALKLNIFCYWVKWVLGNVDPVKAIGFLLGKKKMRVNPKLCLQWCAHVASYIQSYILRWIEANLCTGEDLRGYKAMRASDRLL